MTPLDDLFSTDESRAESQLEKVVILNPAEISDFPNHPFKVKQDEAMLAYHYGSDLRAEIWRVSSGTCPTERGRRL